MLTSPHPQFLKYHGFFGYPRLPHLLSVCIYLVLFILFTILDILKPLDVELIAKVAKATGKIVTVEDAFIIGGLGGAVCEAVAEIGTPCKVRRLGVPDIFPGFGSFQEQMDHLGYGIEAMKKALKEM